MTVSVQYNVYSIRDLQVDAIPRVIIFTEAFEILFSTILSSYFYQKSHIRAIGRYFSQKVP